MEQNSEFTPVGSKHEQAFLEGPHSRWRDLFFAFDVFKEFLHGFRKFSFVGPCVTVFGSARFKEDHPYYEIARNLSREIVKLGFSVITGGGPGIMEAANRGAKEGGGRSIGCNIVLPKEQKPNPYLDTWVDIDYMFVRKVILMKYSYAFVVMPGGYGTLDEFFGAITLIETGKIKKFPVVMFGKMYHHELTKHVENMVAQQTISPDDAKLFLLTDSIPEAINHLKKYAVEGFGLSKKEGLKPLGILGERKLPKKDDQN